MSETVPTNYYLDCCNLDKILCLHSVLFSFERCRSFACRFLPVLEVSFQVTATDKLVITIQFDVFRGQL